LRSRVNENTTSVSISELARPSVWQDGTTQGDSNCIKKKVIIIIIIIIIIYYINSSNFCPNE